MDTQLRLEAVVTRKPHRCFGCTHQFAAKTILLISVSVGDEGVNNTYFCQDCWSELNSWDELECYPGEIGYWKDNKWFPVQEDQ